MVLGGGIGVFIVFGRERDQIYTRPGVVGPAGNAIANGHGVAIAICKGRGCVYLYAQTHPQLRPKK